MGVAEAARRQSSRAAWRDRVIPMIPAGVAVAFLLALYLGTKLWLVAKFPYNLDEGLVASFAQLGLDPNQRLASLGVGIRPGLVWLTMGGMKLHFSPLISIRLVAVGFGLIGLAAGTIAAYRYVSKTAAATFAVFALFTPFLFLHNAIGYRDSVIAGLMVAGFLLEIELARKPQLAIGLLLGVTFALDILVKDNGKAALYLLPLSLVYFPFRSPQRVRLAGAWIANVVLALLIALAATLPMRLSTLYKNLHETQSSYHIIRPYSQIFSHLIVDFDQSWPAIRGELTSYLTYPVIVLAVIGLGLGLRRRPRFTALVAIWALVQLASVIWVAANVYARYLAPTIPFIILLAAVGVDELVRLATAIFGASRRVALTVAAAAFLALAPSLVFDTQLLFDPASAPFPPPDKFNFITGYVSGFGLNATVDELQRSANGKPIVVVAGQYNHSALPLLTKVQIKSGGQECPPHTRLHFSAQTSPTGL